LQFVILDSQFVIPDSQFVIPDWHMSSRTWSGIQCQAHSALRRDWIAGQARNDKFLIWYFCYFKIQSW